VLGAEERDEFYTVGVSEDVDRAAALRIHSGLIGDEANAFAVHRREVSFFEHVNASFRVVGGM
jgi:hypothetical protein